MRQACQPLMIFQECALKFNEKRFGDIASLKKRMQESLTTMQTLEDKHKRMYPTAKGGSASKREGKKKTETNQKSAGLREKNSQRGFSVAVASSFSYGDNIVEPHLLNKDAISKLGKRDVKSQGRSQERHNINISK